MRAADNDELLRLTCAGNEKIDWNCCPTRNMNLLWSADRHNDRDVTTGVIEDGDIV
jgi:hypothetical protein